MGGEQPVSLLASLEVETNLWAAWLAGLNQLTEGCAKVNVHWHSDICAVSTERLRIKTQLRAPPPASSGRGSPGGWRRTHSVQVAL